MHTTSLVSASGDTELETHSVVIPKIVSRREMDKYMINYF